MFDGKGQRERSFGAHYPAWVAVSHFLSPGLMRELAIVLVREASAGQLALGDLCNEIPPEGPGPLTTWAVQLTSEQDGFAGFLQDVVRALVWQTDVDMRRQAEDIDASDAPAARALETALVLASADFDTMTSFFDGGGELEESLGILAGAIAHAAINGVSELPIVGAVESILSPLGAPLDALGLKHVGDLCIDADRGHDALAFYDRSLELVLSSDEPEWTDMLNALGDLTIQSRAAALWMISGPAAAADVLNKAIADEPDMRSLLRINAGVDAMNARFRGDEYHGDIRIALLESPQVQATHDLERPFEYWLTQKDKQAHRRFWAVLRRRIALGAIALTSEARGYYGRALLDHLGRELHSQRRPDEFSMALRLIVTSGQEESVGDEASGADLLAAYLTQETAEAVYQIATRHEGVRRDRLLVVTKLYRNWVTALTSDADFLAGHLIGRLADIAEAETGVPLLRGHDLGLASVKALKEIALARPEFIDRSSPRFADAILAQLGVAHFRAITFALELAVASSDDLAEEDLARCALAILNLVEARDPSEGSWLRPALGFISSRAVRQLWDRDAGFGARCASELLRHGLGADRENRRLIALLEDILPHLGGSLDDPRIGEAIRSMRTNATKTNNSGIPSDLSVLFSAPSIVGRDGIDDAIKGFVLNLETAQANRPSIAVAHLYDPLLSLTHHLDDIGAEFGLAPSEQIELVEPVVAALVRFWVASKDYPLVFAPFAIPFPTVPNPVVIQNWAFATLGFARRVGAESALREAMAFASENSDLSRAIALGIAVHLAADDPELLDRSTIIAEAREPFYASIGPRLAKLAAASNDGRNEAIMTLSEQCLLHGPNALDVGVFVLAQQAGLVPDVPDTVVKAYRTRLKRNRELRRSLAPLLDLAGFIREQERSDDD